MALGTKWLQGQIVSCRRRSVRSASRSAVTTSCSACSFTTSTPSSSCITSGTSRAAMPVWRSKTCQSTSCTPLRRLRFIGQADGWWSRVDALDLCRRVALLSLSPRDGAPVVFQSITPCLLSNVSIIKQAKPSLFGRDGSCCSGFNPNSHHAVMIINSQEITRVHVRANCTAQLCVARWKANSSTTHSTHSHTCLLARMSLMYEILCFQQEGLTTRCTSLLQRLREQSLPTPMWPSTPHLQHSGPLPSLLSHVLMQPPFNWPLFMFATCCTTLSCRT